MATLSLRTDVRVPPYKKIFPRVFVWQGTYQERLLPKEAGFRWNPEWKLWWTDQPLKAQPLRTYATDNAKQALVEAEAALQASRATDADIDIPLPDGLSFLPYQKAGIAYALRRFSAGQPGVLIGDEMGLGKTIQALGVLRYLKLSKELTKRVLVICPASLKINWLREAEKWLAGLDLTVGIADTKAGAPATDIVIANYDILTKLDLSESWGMLVLDESQYIKNPKTKRTKAVMALRARAKLLLTGTPILNRPVELFTALSICDPAQWNSFFNYGLRYCGGYKGKWGWDFSGATNLDELQPKLRETLMVRRLKKDVLTELPPKRHQIIPLASNGAAALLKKEAKLLDREEAIKALIAGRVVFDQAAELRHALGLAKVKPGVEIIKTALESSPKIVVFAHHKEVLNQLQEALAEYNPVRVSGDTPQQARQAAVDAFQSDDSVRVFLGNIKAAGVGLTLTAASHVIFVEQDWTPGWMDQASDRVHRIGQQDSVLVQVVVFDESIDAAIAKMLFAKEAVSKALLDDEQEDKDLSRAIAQAEAETL